MHRSVAEELCALITFDDRIADRPDLGFVVATAEAQLADGSISVEVSDVGCCPLGLVTIARSLLATAHGMLTADPVSRERGAEMAAYVSAGIAVLDAPEAFVGRP